MAEACRAQGADVRVKVLDVTDEEGVRRWVEECEAAAPFEVVFANAGVATGAEKEANVRRTFRRHCHRRLVRKVRVLRQSAGAARRRH